MSSTLLCPALYYAQHITVSSTLLCPTKYCIHTYPKGLLFTFYISTCCGRIMLRLRSTCFLCWQNQSCLFLLVHRGQKWCFLSNATLTFRKRRCVTIFSETVIGWMLELQGNLSKSNNIGTEFVRFTQVFGLDRLCLQGFFKVGTISDVWFTQVFSFLRVWFRQVSLYKQIYICRLPSITTDKDLYHKVSSKRPQQD